MVHTAAGNTQDRTQKIIYTTWNLWKERYRRVYGNSALTEAQLQEAIPLIQGDRRAVCLAQKRSRIPAGPSFGCVFLVIRFNVMLCFPSLVYPPVTSCCYSP
jgi:hypothetical protein